MADTRIDIAAGRQSASDAPQAARGQAAHQGRPTRTQE